VATLLITTIKNQNHNQNQNLQFKITRLQVYKAFSDEWFDNEIMRLQSTARNQDHKLPEFDQFKFIFLKI